MSHTTKSTLAVHDWQLFDEAVKELGCTWDRNATEMTYYGGAKAQVNNGVISAKGATWQAGLVTNDETGETGFLMDNYGSGGGLVEKIGEDGIKLKELYTEKALRKVARAQGATVQRVEPSTEERDAGIVSAWEIVHPEDTQAEPPLASEAI